MPYRSPPFDNRFLKVRKDTANWVAMAEYDLETARALLASQRYLYVIFMCHIALEKMLKAHVTEITQTFPVKTHDLIYLIKESKIQLPSNFLDFIGIINNVSIPTRYPEDLSKILGQYSYDVASHYLKQTEEIILWLKQHPNLNK